MSTSSKKLKPLSSASLSKMITKLALRSQKVEKASGVTNHTLANSLELTKTIRPKQCVSREL